VRIARGEFSVRLGEERSDEIGDLVRDLNRMAAGLERLELSRRRWIAEILHELRTPLTVLRGELDALEDGLRPFGAAALASLREEALRLGAVVDDLHLLAMADLEALPVHPVADDATRIVARVRERFALRAAERGLTLELEAPPEGSLKVHWDGPRIEQLLGNLLENSLRYTDAPGTIRLTVAPNADAIDLDVDDSPPGVPPAVANAGGVASASRSAGRWPGHIVGRSTARVRRSAACGCGCRSWRWPPASRRGPHGDATSAPGARGRGRPEDRAAHRRLSGSRGLRGARSRRLPRGPRRARARAPCECIASVYGVGYRFEMP
jgi:hypothetical protein